MAKRLRARDVNAEHARVLDDLRRVRPYHLRDVPADLLDRAIARAEADGLSVRGVLIGLLELYVERGVRILPRPKAARDGRRKTR